MSLLYSYPAWYRQTRAAGSEEGSGIKHSAGASILAQSVVVPRKTRDGQVRTDCTSKTRMRLQWNSHWTTSSHVFGAA